jgi:acyl-CoA synthetase (AMP-forming)/AMP-acid ligase II
MGGLQVIFQALANGNTLVDLYRKDRDSVLMEIKERSVSHLSATPTFYRLLGPPSVSLPLVMRVTVGGELAQGSTFQLIEKMFPEASINNIYATTETGAILFSKNEVFEVNKKVRITDNILYVKGPSGSWYNTGDTVEVCSENPLRFTFTGRSTDIINVGGNNVNPNQIEEILRNHPDIKDALVFGKKNSVLGNILACEIVSRKDSLSKEDVVNHLNSFNLEGFKIPRFFKFKEEVAISDNLKTKR